jgi:RNA polymerase sigma-19 factor, ECF subfamily
MSLPRADGQLSDRDSVDAIRAGNYGAFDMLFRDHADPLVAYVAHILGSPEEAEEVVHDLFLWLWKHRADWSVPGTIRTYLYRAARNRAVSHLRHRKVEWLFGKRRAKWAGLTLESVDAISTGRIEADELSARIDRGIRALPERCRHVFLLNRQHHLTYSEIAQVLHLSPKTVERHMGRALAGMREALADWR